MIVPQEYAHHLLLKIEGRIGFVRTSEIRYVEAARDYVRLHTGSATFVRKGRISDLERRLDPSRFLRIHRSYIVAIDRIADIRPVAYGDYAVVVEGGASIPLSRSHRSELTRLLRKVG
jgi:two-component system LytT family response regulator